MTDSGRSLFKKVRSDDRLAVPSIKQEKSSLEDGLNAAVATLKNKKVAIVGSCQSTLEELYLLNRLSKASRQRNIYEVTFLKMTAFFFLPIVLLIYGELLLLDLSILIPEKI